MLIRRYDKVMYRKDYSCDRLIKRYDNVMYTNRYS